MNETSKLAVYRNLNLDCAVPDCEEKATRTARISINNLPKKRLPVCKAHGDAAKEDNIKVKLSHPLYAKNFIPTHLGLTQKMVPITVTIDRREAIDDLKKLNGLPPYDGFNPCAGDGYFALSLTKKYGMSVEELSDAVGFKKLVDEWNLARAAFASKF